MTAAISILLALGLAEVAVRGFEAWVEWETLRRQPPPRERAIVASSDPVLTFEFNPGWSDEGFSINSHGMLEEEVPREKPAGVFRIALVGDSVTAGFGLLPAQAIYREILETRLNARSGRRGAHPRAHALNFAVNGYGILQTARMAITRVPPFEPDIVVAQLSLNDPYPSPMPGLARAPAHRVRLFGLASRWLSPARYWARMFVELKYDARGMRNVEHGMAELAALAREGPPVLALLFPYLHRPAYDEWGFIRYHEMVRGAARRAGVPMLDLYGAFREAALIEPRWPQDPIHPDARGHALAARVLRAELARLGWLEPLLGP